MPRYYDPHQDPDPEEWLMLDQASRIRQIEKYHNKNRIRLPNAHMHSVMHETIENQIAEGIPEIVEALARLKREGLNRHDALHAIAWVLSQQHFELSRAQPEEIPEDPNPAFLSAVSSLHAKDWLALANAE